MGRIVHGFVDEISLQYFTRFSFWGFTPGWIHGSITDTNSCINSKDKSQKFISAETSVS